MVLLISTLWYAFLTFLGLGINPETRPGEFAVGPSCSEFQVTSDSVSCSYIGDRTVCSVQCDDRNSGEYTCTEGEGWSPELPPCARPTEDELDEEFPLNARCNDFGCNTMCLRHRKQIGKCEGTECKCYSGFPYLTDDDEPISAGCNPRRCKEWCQQHKKQGSCVGKKCKCN